MRLPLDSNYSLQVSSVSHSSHVYDTIILMFHHSVTFLQSFFDIVGGTDFTAIANTIVIVGLLISFIKILMSKKKSTRDKKRKYSRKAQNRKVQHTFPKHPHSTHGKFLKVKKTNAKKPNRQKRKKSSKWKR